MQDAFVAMHGRWSRLREPDMALAYLRKAVVNRSRSALRHRKVADRYARERGLATLTDPGDARARGGRRNAVLDGVRRCPPASARCWRSATTSSSPRPNRRHPRGQPRLGQGHASRGAAALRTHLEGPPMNTHEPERPQPSPVRRRGPDRAALGHRGDPLPHRTHEEESPMATSRAWMLGAFGAAPRTAAVITPGRWCSAPTTPPIHQQPGPARLRLPQQPGVREPHRTSRSPCPAPPCPSTGSARRARGLGLYREFVGRPRR